MAKRRRPHTRRSTRKRRTKRVRSRVTAGSVMRALGSTYPWKMGITHFTGQDLTAINEQSMHVVTAVGAVGTPASGTIDQDWAEHCYRSMAEQNNILIPYNATYAVASEATTGRNYSHKFLFKSQKARVMFTNSSASSMFLEIYHLYMRREMDESNAVGIYSAATSATSFTDQEGVISGTTANTSLTIETPGVTPYDNPTLAKLCYIKRIGIKRLEPGANALHLMRTNRSHVWSPGDTIPTATDQMYLPKLTVFLLVRFWGEIVSGTGAPVMAPVKLVYGTIVRTKYKRITEPIYGGLERGTDSRTMSSGTGGLVITQENPAATAVTGFVPNVV